MIILTKEKATSETNSLRGNISISFCTTSNGDGRSIL